MLALRFAFVMIFAGPFGPKSIAETFVASENVGDGGVGDTFRLDEMARERRDLARGMFK